jgi:uncharacterized protein YjbJ (UPF0337 family)
MSWERIEGDWKAFRGRVRTRWDKLTEDDLETVAGQKDELAARIQARYGIEREIAHREIDSWLREPGVLDDWNDTRPILDM